MRGIVYISFKSKLRSVNIFSNYFCNVGLCSVVAVSIHYSSFEVTFWTVRTLEFRIKWFSIVVNVLISLFCLMIFFQLDGVALRSCIHWKYKLFCKSYSCLRVFRSLTLFRMGLFGAAQGWGDQKVPPLHKICHSYPTMMKLGTLTPYLKKIEKIYKSRDTPLEFYWHQQFFTRNWQILLYQEIQI